MRRREKMSDDAVVFSWVIVLFMLFWGDPDLFDAIKGALMAAGGG